MQLGRRVLDVVFAVFSAFTFVIQFFHGGYLYVALASAWILAILLAWEIIELKDRPRIKVQHTPGTAPYWMAGSRLHRVGVKTRGVRDAEDVQVRLQRIDPDPRLLIDVIPSKFGHKGGQCSEGNTVCNISSKDEHHFDVIQFLCDLSKDGTLTGENWCWRLVTVEFTYQPIDLAVGVDYAFHIRARAKGAPSDDRVLNIRRNFDDSLDVSLRD
jgi:hypothetical protein